MSNAAVNTVPSNSSRELDLEVLEFLFMLYNKSFFFTSLANT